MTDPNTGSCWGDSGGPLLIPLPRHEAPMRDDPWPDQHRYPLLQRPFIVTSAHCVTDPLYGPALGPAFGWQSTEPALKVEPSPRRRTRWYRRTGWTVWVVVAVMAVAAYAVWQAVS